MLPGAYVIMNPDAYGANKCYEYRTKRISMRKRSEETECPIFLSVTVRSTKLETFITELSLVWKTLTFF